MAKYDERWITKHRGPLTTRRMSAVLTRISSTLGRAVDDLALTKVSKRRKPFHVLVACIISLRTKDEVTDEVAPRLLDVAPTPAIMATTSEKRIARLIYPAGFYRTKAATLKKLGKTLDSDHAGKVPDTLDGLLALDGVGRKTANLVITMGFGKPGICVDTHVHRISNRLTYVKTDSPDDTEMVLRAHLPKRWWIPINDLLVAWGRTICKPISPLCSTCPVAHLCPRKGVDLHR